MFRLVTCRALSRMKPITFLNRHVSQLHHSPHSQEHLYEMMSSLRKTHGELAKLQITELKKGHKFKGLDMGYDLPRNVSGLYPVECLTQLPLEEQDKIRELATKIPVRAGDFTLNDTINCIVQLTESHQKIYYIDNRLTTKSNFSYIEDVLKSSSTPLSL